jgi:ribose-phosphate pyrophosphokinase
MDFIEMERRIFPDGEVNPRIIETPQRALLVNMLSSHAFDPNRYILEYIYAIKNLLNRGTEKILLILPYLPYSRQDAVFRKGESFTSKFILEIFRDLGIEDIFSVTFHLHRQKKVKFVEGIRLHNISGITALAEYLTEYTLSNPLCLAPDEEAEKWAQEVADTIDGEVAVLKKRRDVHTGDIQTVGEIPTGRNIIIIDDMISTGTTIHNALTICREYNAQRVVVSAVHGIFSRPVDWNVDIITTNTIENPHARVDVTPYLAEALWKFL